MKIDINHYTLKNPETVDSPALLIYTDIARENIQKALTIIKDPDRLRPHVKTNKAVEACQLMMAAGIGKFKCATIAEAEMLVKAGAKDILLAYQPVGPKQARWEALVRDHADDVAFSCLIDNLQTAQELSDKGKIDNVVFKVYIDLNAGTDRTGIAVGEPAEKLYNDCKPLDHLNVLGFHVYDGHLRQEDWNERKTACDEGFQKVGELAARLRSEGEEVDIVAGGSTTFGIHAQRAKVVCSPGTFIYWDQGYIEGLPEQDFVPAALVLTRVISLPAPGLVCVDLGHKSVSAENPLPNRVHFIGEHRLQPVGQSEEHLVLQTDTNHSYKVGDILLGIPFHVCPTVALYESASTIENGIKTGEWKILARDKRLHY